ncbi:hypothetical protein ACSHT2_10110 [Bradyrhizobium sp. PUT101]|uniref:hypothetical protein n=1 Tax=Bradyrhizobium sp. PUT101 TaxID=3447427 RepID=UPI003F84C97D
MAIASIQASGEMAVGSAKIERMSPVSQSGPPFPASMPTVRTRNKPVAQAGNGADRQYRVRCGI